MATVTSSPQNIIAGQPTTVSPSGGGPSYGAIWCVVFNTTSSLLIVQSAGGSRFLQPNNADVFPVDNAIPTPLVVAQTNQPNGTYLGTITSQWGDVNDPVPTGYPVQLTSFTAGEQLVVNNLDSNSFTLAPPIGSGALILGTPGGGTNEMIDLTVTGVQSGYVYYYNILPPNPVTVPLIGAADTSYKVTVVLFDAPNGINMYAQQGSPAPVFPTTVTRTALTVATENVLAAITSGAYYLFGYEVDSLSAATVGPFLDLPGGQFALSNEANEATGSFPLWAFRVPAAATPLVGGTTAGTAIVSIAWALGP